MGVENASNLLDYLQRAAARPGMYFGSTKLRHVRLHLDGWRAHRTFSADEDWFADAFFQGFHAFVGRRYSDGRTLGWDGLIADHEPAERHFETFMVLVAEFAGHKAKG